MKQQGFHWKKEWIWIVGLVLLFAGFGLYSAFRIIVEGKPSRSDAIWTTACLAPAAVVYLVMGILAHRAHRWHISVVAPLGLAGTFVALVALSLLLASLYQGGCDHQLVPNGTAAYCDLTGRDLSGMNLRGINLSGATLVSTNLQGADLSGADLTRAVMRRADLRDAALTGAVLDGAIVSEAHGLTDATLAEAFRVPLEWLPGAIAQSRIQFEAASTIDEGLREVCQGTGVAEALAYSADAPVHTIAAFGDDGAALRPGNHERDSDWYAWESELRAEWMPLAVRFVDVVVCIGPPQKVVLETCQYYMGNLPGAAFQRTQTERTVTLRAAQTGKPVTERAFLGDLPEDDCPESVTLDSEGRILSTAKVAGPDSGYHGIEEWLGSVLVPTAPYLPQP